MPKEEKKCPFCAEMIDPESIKCPTCGEALSQSGASHPESNHLSPALELYNPGAAASLSVFFTPVFGAYIIRKNWETIGNQMAAQRSKIWLKVCVAVTVIATLFLDTQPAYGVSFFTLIAWYFMEAKPQVAYLQKNHPRYLKKSWRSPLVTALVIGVAWFFFIMLFSAIFGGPTLDCSSNQAFRESGNKIFEYIKEDIAPLIEKYQDGDVTPEERDTVVKLAKLKIFFINNGPGSLLETVQEDIDGMSAYDLLEYVDENYDIGGGYIGGRK